MEINSKEASKLFNRKTIAAIANGDLSFVEKVSRYYLNQKKQITVSQVFDFTLQKLGSEYRSEYFYKNTIAKKILLGRHSLNTATMLTEFRVGSSKADCVILNGKSSCYEIKSDFDSLDRLSDQISDYLQIFDEVFVVCSLKHYENVLKIIPKSVGIIILTDKNTLSLRRKPLKRASPINIEMLCKSLRKSEYIELAIKLSGDKLPSMPNSLLFTHCFNTIKKYDRENISELFVEIIKKSRMNNEILIKALPSSLLNAVISYKLTKSEETNLISVFS